MKRVLLIEPHCAGHHSVYLNWLVQGLVDLGMQLQIGTLESSLQHPLFQNIQRQYSQIPIISLPDSFVGDTRQGGVFNLIRREFFYYGLFKKLFRIASENTDFDAVFVPYVDYCTYAIAFLGSPFEHTPWNGIVMRPSFHYREMDIVCPASAGSRLKKRLFLRLLAERNLKTLFTTDETLKVYIDNKWTKFSNRLEKYHDPVHLPEKWEKNEARRFLGIPASVPLILIYGAITGRKGVDRLLLAFNEYQFPKGAHVLLAGKQSEDVQQILRGYPLAQKLMKEHRLHQLPGFIDADQEIASLSAADILWLGYRDHYVMSGVLVQAGRMGLPVIADECGLIGWYTSKYSLGVVVKSSDTHEVARAVRILIEDKEFASECGKNGERLFAGNTVKQFINLIAKDLL